MLSRHAQLPVLNQLWVLLAYFWMSGTHSFERKTFARPHIISFLQPLCLINYYFFHNTVIFSTTLHFSKALSKPSLGSAAASTQILTWFIFPGTFSSLTDIKRARVLDIHIRIKIYIFGQLQRSLTVCISFLSVTLFCAELTSCSVRFLAQQQIPLFLWFVI